MAHGFGNNEKVRKKKRRVFQIMTQLMNAKNCKASLRVISVPRLVATHTENKHRQKQKQLMPNSKFSYV